MERFISIFPCTCCKSETSLRQIMLYTDLILLRHIIYYMLIIQCAKSSYSLCQKKRTFNPEFFYATPLGEGGSHIVNFVNFWPPPPGRPQKKKKIGIKCVFLLTQTVQSICSLQSICEI